MSKHRNRHKEKYIESTSIHESYIELNKNKFVIKREKAGQYCILNIMPEATVMVVRVRDSDDEYALNCIQETLDYITRDI